MYPGDHGTFSKHPVNRFNGFECYDAGNESTNGTLEPMVPIVDRNMEYGSNPQIHLWATCSTPSRLTVLTV
jgi:hypothetical protein